MLALLLAFGLFVFLILVGKATLELLRYREPILRSWLLAPSVGLSVIILLVLNLNQLGMPVKSFAWGLTAALAVFVAAVFWWRRPIFPWRQLGLFLGIALVSLLYTCWPMLLYGFHWVGYMNGDMGTYCLGALRAMHYGFYRIPTLTELQGTDYSQYWWFHYAAGLFRCGTDLFLAWFASVTEHQPLQITMPALGALNLAQLFTAASLAFASLGQRRLAIVGACLLAVSPFFILGVMTQVMPQVGGITLLLGLCTLCMKSGSQYFRGLSLLRNGVLVAIVGSALCIYYPEVLPFGVLAIGGFHAYHLFRRRESVFAVGVFGLSIFAILLLVARQSLFTAVGTVLFALSAGVKMGAQIVATDFDTVLDPSIFASLFGLEPYYGTRADPWISLAILAGILLAFASSVICIRRCLKGQPQAFLLLVMIGLGLQLFFSNSAFALFKLAMYIQPVLVFALAVPVLKLPARKAGFVLVAYLVASFSTTRIYTIKSTGLVIANSVALPTIFQSDIRGFPLPTGEAVRMDTPNMVGDYVFAGANIGTDTYWADMDVFRGFAETYTLPAKVLPLPAEFGLMPNYLMTAQSLRDAVSSGGRTETILGHSLPYRMESPEVAYLGSLSRDPWDSSNNGRTPSDSYFTFHKLTDVRNHLILISTDKGGPHYRSHALSRWPVEADWYRPSHTFYAVGRRLLFEVVNPTPNVRLRISLSRTLTGEGRTRLPQSATVNGVDSETLPLTGNGAANIISAPIHLVESRHRYYFSVDFGVDGDYFPNRKTGLMRLFNVQIPADPRRVVGFARDISLVEDQHLANLQRPRAITSWPEDLLRNGDLEFSGIYEDGWVSNSAFIVLGKGARGEKLVVRGDLPPFLKLGQVGTELSLDLNGERIYSGHLKAGPFQIEHSLTSDTVQNRLEFKFGGMERLRRGDDRPVAAHLRQIEISGRP